MASQGKRKDPSSEAAGRQGKKKKHGNEGKWKTPHYESKFAAHQGNTVAPGDAGVWVTCARNQEKRAAREVKDLFEEYAEAIYGVERDGGGKGGGDDDNDEEEGEEDIEAAVKRELEMMKPNSGNSATRLFTPVTMNISCLLFVKTKPPVEPVDFVKRICVGARSGNSPRNIKTRYVNRLTPMVLVGKATEQGVVEVARKVLAPWFDLSGKREVAGPEAEPATARSNKPYEGAESDTKQSEGKSDGASNDAEGLGDEPSGLPAQTTAGVEVTPSYSFAIRPSIRNNKSLKHLVVINQIASLINDDRHKVNLTAPDKVILVDIFQNVCGMSVVDGDWDDLKRYNLTELQSLANQTGDEPEP